MSALYRTIPAKRSANEIALDESLRDFEEVLKADIIPKDRKFLKIIPNEEEKPQQPVTQTTQSTAPQHIELEELCKEVFEDIDASTEIEMQEIDTNIVKQEVEVTNKQTNETTKDEQLLCIQIDALQEEEEEEFEKSHSAPAKHKHTRDSTNLRQLFLLNQDSYAIKTLEKLLKLHIHYVCPICGLVLTNQTTWRSHVFKEHKLNSTLDKYFQDMPDDNAYSCRECQTILKTSKTSDLHRHRFEHMPFKSYLKCTLCQRTKSSKPKILMHLKHNHGKELEPIFNSIMAERVFTCRDCSTNFRSESNWYQHRSSECAQRLSKQQPQSVVRLYSIEKNMKLLEHLHKARKRLKSIAAGNEI